MRKKILSLIIAAFSGIAFAQETIPMYQQYLFDSEFLFNPAFWKYRRFRFSEQLIKTIF